MSFNKVERKSKKGAIVTPMTCSTVQSYTSRIGGKRGHHWSFSFLIFNYHFASTTTEFYFTVNFSL